MLRAPILGLCLAGAALIFEAGAFDAGAARAHEVRARAPAAEAEADPGPATSPFPADIGGAFALIDHGGRPVTEADFRGRFMLLFFGYANCPGVCPIGLRTLTEAVDLLGDQGGAVLPVLITVDPERDTLATLGPVLAKIHPRLIGLTGTPEQLAAARQAYKVGAKVTGKDLNGGALFEHGTFIYLMGPDGKFLSLFPPVIDPPDLAAAIARYMS